MAKLLNTVHGIEIADIKMIQCSSRIFKRRRASEGVCN